MFDVEKNTFRPVGLATLLNLLELGAITPEEFLTECVVLRIASLREKGEHTFNRPTSTIARSSTKHLDLEGFAGTLHILPEHLSVKEDNWTRSAHIPGETCSSCGFFHPGGDCLDS